MSVSILVHFEADFNAKDKDGCSAVDLARLLGNRQCYEIASKKKEPLPKPESPFIGRGKNCVLIPLPSSYTLCHKYLAICTCFSVTVRLPNKEFDVHVFV